MRPNSSCFPSCIISLYVGCLHLAAEQTASDADIPAPRPSGPNTQFPSGLCFHIDINNHCTGDTGREIKWIRTKRTKWINKSFISPGQQILCKMRRMSESLGAAMFQEEARALMRGV